MADFINKVSSTNSYGQGFSSSPRQMEHQKAMVQEDHEYQLKMQDSQHFHELSLKNKDLGWIGQFFGSSDNSSKNIAAIICLILLIAVIFMSCIVYYLDKDKGFISTLWQMVMPVITLSLGYIFGKRG